MRKSGRIRGTVTYLNENGQRTRIPLGPCEIEEYGAPNKVAATIWWNDEYGVHKTDLSELEWAQYGKSKSFTIDD